MFPIEQLIDYRVEFTKWWITEFKTVKFPAQGTVFDYYIESDTKKFEPWTKKIPKFEFDYELPLQVSLAFFLCCIIPLLISNVTGVAQHVSGVSTFSSWQVAEYCNLEPYM